jgi:proteasome lid subunit RPN8/RPN11
MPTYQLEIPPHTLERIHQHGESAYPDEGVGFLLGSGDERRQITTILPLPNGREAEARRRRYLISPEDTLCAEQEADRCGLTLVGVFHSHPDHPEVPSEYDREWALPWFSYLITRVAEGQAVVSRAWRLRDDRSGFDEERIIHTASSNE